MIDRIISWFIIVIPPVIFTLSIYYVILVQSGKIPFNHKIKLIVTIIILIFWIGTMSSFTTYVFP